MGLTDPAEPGTEGGDAEAGGPLPAVPAAGMARSDSTHAESVLPEAAGEGERG